MKKVFLLGAFLGLFIVRSFMLDILEELGWHAFWEEFGRGTLTGEYIFGTVLQSATFGKCFIGMVVGGVVAVIITMFYKDFIKDGKCEKEDEERILIER